MAVTDFVAFPSSLSAFLKSFYLLYQQAIGFRQGQGRCCASSIAVTSSNANANAMCIVYTIFIWNKTWQSISTLTGFTPNQVLRVGVK